MDKSNSKNNVTLRKRLPLFKSVSLESLDAINDTLNTTQSDEYLTRSIDLSSHLQTNIEEELRSEISKLKSSLSSTQNELDNIILENLELKKKLSQLNQEVTILKNLCTSPVTSIKKKKRLNKKERVRRRLTESFLNTSENADIISPVENLTTSNSIQSVPILSEESNVCTNSLQKNNGRNVVCKKIDFSNSESSTTKDNVEVLNLKDKKINKKPYYQNLNYAETNTQHRLFIFGGKQCSTLSENLIKSRRHNPYVRYKISSFIKPYAETEDILRCCALYDITSEDRVILCVGEHDSNPTKVMIELSSILKSLYMCPVLILKVFNNKFLNEIKLNNMLKSICNQFSHCKFVDDSIDFIIGSHKYYIQHVCKGINSALDKIDYDLKFLPFIKDSVKIMHAVAPVKTFVNASTQTIDYYPGILDGEENFFRLNKCRWNLF